MTGWDWWYPPAYKVCCFRSSTSMARPPSPPISRCSSWGLKRRIHSTGIKSLHKKKTTKGTNIRQRRRGMNRRTMSLSRLECRSGTLDFCRIQQTTERLFQGRASMYALRRTSCVRGRGEGLGTPRLLSSLHEPLDYSFDALRPDFNKVLHVCFPFAHKPSDSSSTKKTASNTKRGHHT